jgi:hypothetical protein
VRCLVELGGVEQLQAMTTQGAVPMHFAARSNPSAEVVRCLVELGGVGQLRAMTTQGCVPMHFAAASNPSAEVVRCLVELGGVGQLRATNTQGCVPMHFAARSNPSVEVVRYLLGRGCDRNPRSHRGGAGGTPLVGAIRRGNKAAEVSALLVEAGAHTTGLQLSSSLQRIASGVSVASVLSSYFVDNLTPLGAAVRSPPDVSCMCTSSLVSSYLGASHDRARGAGAELCLWVYVCGGRSDVSRSGAACTHGSAPRHDAAMTRT